MKGSRRQILYHSYAQELFGGFQVSLNAAKCVSKVRLEYYNKKKYVLTHTYMYAQENRQSIFYQ